jgi:hypothetical protein
MNDTTKRDTPFPNSSSTPVSIKKLCDDPNDPNYWKENITTNEDRGIKVPISQPGIPLTEFAERLIALEQENVVLREGIEQLEAEVAKLKILVQLAIGLGGSAMFVLHNDSERWNGLCKYMAHMGLDSDTAFEINGDGVIVRRDGKEIPECSLKNTDEPSPTNGVS